MSKSALELGQAFLTENAKQPGVITTATGLQYLVLTEGTGLQTMKEGGKTRFFIPSHLAYGKRGAGIDIGPDETLIFEVELLKVWED